MHDLISGVIVSIAGQNITPLLVRSVELFENNIRISYAYFFNHTSLFLRTIKYNTRMLKL